MASRVIVVGASMAGLCAARALTDDADEVVIVERDDLAGYDGARRGVPQGRHAHALLAAGERTIEEWFPGIVDELQAGGAVRGDGGDGLWWQAGALKVRAQTGILATFMSRPFLEETVRRRLLRLDNVTLRTGVRVEGLVTAGQRVSGVIVDGEAMDADLVVDCSGRNTRLLDDLEAAGFPPAPTSSVRIDMSYATVVLRRTPDDTPSTYLISAPTPPFENRFGVLLPIEGDRWILTIGGFHGDAAPTDDQGYMEYARSLPLGEIADVLDNAEELSPVMTHRLASNQRRHFERLSRVPAGYTALGDAVCSFNPIYGQGMSSAALQAGTLASAVRHRGLGTPSMVSSFYRAAAKVVENPWKIAAGSDFLHPMTTGPKPPGTDFINRYVGMVQRATHVSPAVLRQMQLVQNLLAAPTSLMAPATVLRVLRTARRSPAVLTSEGIELMQRSPR